MAKMPISPEELKLYFQGNKRHAAFEETEKLYQKLKKHAEGELPGDLIKKRRPSESNETHAYRNEIYVAKTKNPITKVINSLSKIRRSQDWGINYKEVFLPANVVEDERLEAYCESNYPGYESLTNWMFSIGLKNQCVDGNAVIAVFPKEMDWAENGFPRAVAMLFNSDNVVFFEEGEDFAILKSTETSDLTDGDKTTYNAGAVYYVISTTFFARYDQVNASLNFQRTQYYEHNFGKLPVFKLPAQYLKNKGNTTIQESRLAPMLPHLDEAAREYSDLQAAKVQHMFPLFWYVSTKDCGHCAGSGKVIDKSTTEHCVANCNICTGTGKVKFSPYSAIEINPAKLGEQQVPVPGAGYISRDVEIIKHQEESCQQHLYEALSSINMQFMDQTPLNISGEAKSVDREELNNFVYSVAEDLVRAMDRIYYWINEWRYSFAVPDKNKRREMLPKINVPENFDLLPEGYLMDEIGKAKTAKVNPNLIAVMEHDYAVKKFYNDPEIAAFSALYFDLDPMPALSEDEKMVRLSNKGVSVEDYVISCNLVTFLKRALGEKGDVFRKMKYDDKMKALLVYAKEKMKVISEADKLRIAVQGETEPILN